MRADTCVVAAPVGQPSQALTRRKEAARREAKSSLGENGTSRRTSEPEAFRFSLLTAVTRAVRVSERSSHRRQGIDRNVILPP